MLPCIIVYQGDQDFFAVRSVLVHLLPGLALFALQHAPFPTASSQNAALRVLSLADKFQQQQQHLRQHPLPSAQLIWLVVAPLGFYAVWQLSYWFIVQVCCEKFIIQHKYDTSYSCLAKRASKTNSLLNRFIRRGCKARRIFLFGKDVCASPAAYRTFAISSICQATCLYGHVAVTVDQVVT